MNTQSNFSWEEMDKLNRQEDAQTIINFLKTKFSETLSFSLNVNAEWGYGKTRLLEGIQHELKSGDFPHLTVYFDAWKNDLSPDPLGNFVITVTRELLSHFQNKPVIKTNAALRNGLFTLGKIITTGVVGFLARQIGEEATEQIGSMVSGLSGSTENNSPTIGTKTIDDAAKGAIESFNKMMNDVESKYKALNQVDVFRQALKIVFDEIQQGDEHMLPIFILIDELDRCKPTYAIELLECTKHLFSTEGVYFIFATNTEQLCHTICKVYGDKFDARKYLRRFFDHEYKLSQPDYSNYAEELFGKNPDMLQSIALPGNWTAGKSFAICMTAFDVPPRDQLKIFGHINACCRMVEAGKTIDYSLLLVLVTIFFRFEDIYMKIKPGRASGFSFRPVVDSDFFGVEKVVDMQLFSMDGTSITSILKAWQKAYTNQRKLDEGDEATPFTKWIFNRLPDIGDPELVINQIYSLIGRVKFSIQ